MPVCYRVLIADADDALGTQLRQVGPIVAENTCVSGRLSGRSPVPPDEDRTADFNNFAAMLDVVEGCDAIVSLGRQALEGPRQTILNASIIGAYNVH